ncbi:MAG TPA: hypothetical protein VMF65_07495 [Acidimicrobiales bacterium]|nr:hypothetical protein [Acidimicrobiales bacterium]
MLATQVDRSSAWPATDAEQSGVPVGADADVLDPAVAGAAEAAGVTMAANIAIVATDRVVDINIGWIFLFTITLLKGPAGPVVRPHRARRTADGLAIFLRFLCAGLVQLRLCPLLVRSG